MASIPSERFYNNNWIKIHKKHCFQVKQENINSIIIGVNDGSDNDNNER